MFDLGGFLIGFGWAVVAMVAFAYPKEFRIRIDVTSYIVLMQMYKLIVKKR